MNTSFCETPFFWDLLGLSQNFSLFIYPIRALRPVERRVDHHHRRVIPFVCRLLWSPSSRRFSAPIFWRRKNEVSRERRSGGTADRCADATAARRVSRKHSSRPSPRTTDPAALCHGLQCIRECATYIFFRSGQGPQ